MTNGTVAMRKMFAACAGTLLAVSLGVAVPAAGQVRLTVPEESLSGPFYARLERGYVHQTDEWVAIAFYRQPSCVRQNFNLLNFFDFNNIPWIFSCPLTVHGFEIWQDRANDQAPRQSRFQGNGAVPVWFVSVADFDLAAGDNKVTILELLAMESLLQGVADKFEETLHPYGGAKRSMIRVVAHGDLSDGRTFYYVATEANGVLQHIEIRFR